LTTDRSDFIVMFRVRMKFRDLSEALARATSW